MSSLQCAFLIITSNLAVYITLHLLLQQVKPIPRLQGTFFIPSIYYFPVHWVQTYMYMYSFIAEYLFLSTFHSTPWHYIEPTPSSGQTPFLHYRVPFPLFLQSTTFQYILPTPSSGQTYSLISSYLYLYTFKSTTFTVITVYLFRFILNLFLHGTVFSSHITYFTLYYIKLIPSVVFKTVHFYGDYMTLHLLNDSFITNAQLHRPIPPYNLALFWINIWSISHR